MDLLSYISEQTALGPTTLAVIDDLFERRHCKKYDLLLKAGTQSREVFYVEQGLLRLYYYKEDKEVTHTFLVEKMFYFPVENVYYEQYYRFYLEALEACELRVASFDAVEQLVNEHQELERFMRLLLISAIKNLNERLYAVKFQTAQERYELLLKNYPEIVRRAPLGHIASLLGITQQTLSVVRGAQG